MLFVLITCSQPAYSVVYSLVINKGDYQVAVQLPGGHHFTEEILGLMRDRDVLGATIGQYQEEFPDEPQGDVQKFKIVRSLVREFSLPYELVIHGNDIEQVSEQDGRFYYKPASLLTNSSFVISVAESQASRIWRDLFIEREQSSANRLNWLFVIPLSVSDNPLMPQEITGPSYASWTNVLNMNEPVEACPVTDSELDCISKKGKQIADGALEPLNANLQLLVDFYRSLRSRVAETVNEANGCTVSDAERRETIDEYTQLTNGLSVHDIIRWGFYSGLAWADIEPFSDAIIEKGQGNRELGLKFLLESLANLPKPHVKGAIMLVAAGRGNRLEGPWFDKNMVKTFVDRLTVDRLGAVPQGFISRYGFEYMINCISKGDSRSIRFIFYENFSEAYSFVPMRYAENMSHSHWIMAHSEYLRSRKQFDLNFIQKHFDRFPAHYPQKMDLDRNYEELTAWWTLRKMEERQLVMLPRDCPFKDIYFSAINPVNGPVYGADDFSGYIKTKLLPDQPEVTVKLWHAEISQSQRQQELVFYRNFAKSSFTTDRFYFVPAFIPAVENKLLRTGGNGGDELAGLVLPVVGSSLRDVTILSDKLNLWQKISLFKEIAGAIQWAHTKNIVFSWCDGTDVKTALEPANIRIDERGHAVCTSFQHARSNSSLLPSQQNEWHEEKEADRMAFGKLMIECLLGREFQSFQDALTAAKSPQGEDSEEKLFSVWLRDRLIFYGIALIEERASIADVEKQLKTFSAMNFYSDSVALHTRSVSEILSQASTQAAASCRLCSSLYSFDDNGRNAMRAVTQNGLSVTESFCRTCALQRENSSADSDAKILRDDISGFENVGDILRVKQELQRRAQTGGATANSSHEDITDVIRDLNISGAAGQVQQGTVPHVKSSFNKKLFNKK
ncbi:hypothetical protein M3P05_08280 [Sansalvadorimonas sp. 2012CJ34-2]|uniref:Protein kinase domain-containing protein n=1 Tax=Parendozoicomonas callyspongiae TaxID=2942213 RepID=A0ABT0PF37_9GAMM|nr:hypothetical protein [Sansalvadorimonas sp. 2012CJ34-2]MCL6269933.1 hypothetical protein [Sansalvadorimonas sp. 2012CJ34-2]